MLNSQSQVTAITPVVPDHQGLFQRAERSLHAQSVPVVHLWAVDHERRGPAVVRNRLLAQVTTPYVTFLDADDWLEPGFIARTLGAIQPNHYVYTNWVKDDAPVEVPPNPWCSGSFHLVTALIPTEAARAVGGFDETLEAMEDTDFFFKLLVRGVCGIHLPEALVHYAPEGGRAEHLHQIGALDELRAEMARRYGGIQLSCCGGPAPVDNRPIGEEQPGDVLAQAKWQGNRVEHGRATGRHYTRASYPKKLWVDPADIAASPHLWQAVPEPAPAPPPPPVELAEPAGNVRGAAALVAGLEALGIVHAPPPADQVAARPVPAAPLPNVNLIRRLAGVGEWPIFVAPRQDYPSYRDFWELVRLSGYEMLYQDEIDLNDPTATYIFSGPEGIPDCTGAQARTVFWQLEYVGDYTDQENVRTADDLWSSDPDHARRTGARYVLLGSHKGLNPTLDRGETRYDVVMLAYMTERRRQIKRQLDDLNWPPLYPGHGGANRHAILKGARLKLIAHQHDTPAMTPLRYALAAAYRLPVISEAVPDGGPYGEAIRWVPYAGLVDAVRSYTEGGQGEALYRLLCEEWPFEQCVREALATPESETPPVTEVPVAQVAVPAMQWDYEHERLSTIPVPVAEPPVPVAVKDDPTVVAFTRLHYGADYIRYVIRSTEGFADEHCVLYTEAVTFGRTPSMNNPDSRGKLRELAGRAGGERLRWVEGEEVAPRTALRLYADADLLLELDADEVIHPDLCADILARYRAGELTAFEYRLPMLHHWRTFGMVCRDTLRPVRLRLPANKRDDEDQEAQYYPEGNGYIHHFGYARTLDDMRYKIELTQHADEWRAGWWDEVFMAFPARLHDLHPVCHEMWNAEPFDLNDLPPVLKRHKYRKLERII